MKKQTKKHKHYWKLASGELGSIILYCECGQVRECYEDGYQDWNNSKGVYK